MPSRRCTGGDLIPDGTFAKVTHDRPPRRRRTATAQIDRRAAQGVQRARSDVKLLDCEFTVVEGPYARRKFWQMFTVSGGKLDDKGQSIGLEHLQGHLPRHDRQRARPRSQGRERGRQGRSASCRA